LAIRELDVPPIQRARRRGFIDLDHAMRFDSEPQQGLDTRIDRVAMDRELNPVFTSGTRLGLPVALDAAKISRDEGPIRTSGGRQEGTHHGAKKRIREHM
jgi:hypothetical protein